MGKKKKTSEHKPYLHPDKNDVLKNFQTKAPVMETCTDRKEKEGKEVPYLHKETQSMVKEAWAPYNFVPLNSVVIESENIPDQDRYYTKENRKDKEDKKRHTGCIQVYITTRTPLYIRDTLTEKEMQAKRELEKGEQGDEKKKTYINSDFFSPGGKCQIPGSSLRGMVRTMVEIVSFSKFGFFNKNQRYHFRSFADQSLDLREAYKINMLAGNGKKNNGYKQVVKAGYLIKEGNQFKIRPSKDINGVQHFRVEEDLVINKKVFTTPMKIDYGKQYKENPAYRFGYKEIRFTYEKKDEHYSNRLNKFLSFIKVKDICNKDKNLSNSHEGTLVCSGWIGARNSEGKHRHWVVGPPDDQVKTLEFCHGVIENYKNDVDRHDYANLLKYFDKGINKIMVPCFYLQEGNKVSSFGHTGLFRRAYKNTLKDFLPKEMRNFTGFDIAEGIFGTEGSEQSIANEKKNEMIAGRVFFENAVLSGSPDDRLMKEHVPQILSNPKPTTFQHYLVQHQNINVEYKEDGSVKGFNNILNYNDKTWLRGNKLYWHKNGEDWQAESLSFSETEFKKFLVEKDFKGHLNNNDSKKEVKLQDLPEELKRKVLCAIGIYETQHTKIKPIGPRCTFRGKIRFENLSEVELGALLFALDLPEGCCHKLGMGKPLGLGSVDISVELFLSDRKNRYENLFDEWMTPVESAPDEAIVRLKRSFDQFILQQLEINGKSIWDIDRMKQLKRMLDFTKKPSDGKTQYMQIKNSEKKNEFSDRKVLPKPDKI